MRLPSDKNYVPLICSLPQFLQAGPVQPVQLLHKVGYLMPGTTCIVHHLLQETFASLVLFEGQNETILIITFCSGVRQQEGL